MTETVTAPAAEAEQTLPQSAVPAALDRGHLYSPKLSLTRYALDPAVLYDYRPGDLFEPLPEAPRGDAAGYMWWWENAAKEPTPDFLGLRAGDTIVMHSLQGNHFPAVVTSTCRHHAYVRYELTGSVFSEEGRVVETYVDRCNADGQWY